MNPRQLFIAAFLVPSLFCQTQNKEPGGEPAKPTASVMSAKAAPDSYVIGPSDVLVITVWKQPTLSSSILVRPDGMISMPLIGDVQASGMKPLELANQIATELKKFIQDPNVSVVLAQINSKEVYLLGEVQKKGPVQLTADMTLLQAIASAGGLTDYANTKKMYVLRNEAGRQKKIPVQYKKALKGDSESNVLLKSGDTIVVP